MTTSNARRIQINIARSAKLAAKRHQCRPAERRCLAMNAKGEYCNRLFQSRGPENRRCPECENRVSRNPEQFREPTVKRTWGTPPVDHADGVVG